MGYSELDMYHAPELRFPKCDVEQSMLEKADMYSLGLTIYEVRSSIDSMPENWFLTLESALR